MQIDATALALLAAIADAGSLTAAARRLGCTQPALTKQLRRVEQGLGVALFERSLRGVQPTEYGAALLPRARIVRAQVAQGVEELAQLRGRREGRISIALSHLAVIALLPEAMRWFRARWPAVQVRIAPPAFPDRFVGLREGAPDLAVITLPEPLGPEFQVTPLCPTTVVGVVRAGHPRAAARSLAALADAEWVIPDPTSSTARTLFAAFERARLPPPRCPLTCETLTGLELLVGTSDLIGAMPLEVYDVRAGMTGLARLPFEIGLRGSSLALIRWADARPTPAAADMAEALIRAARQFVRSRGYGRVRSSRRDG
ncbi:MAG: LysR family transcriptional regulator [Lautropia sp.]